MVSHIQCVNDEGCKVTVDIQHMNEAVAIEAWNTRPPSERPVAQMREALANRLGEIAGRVPLERDRETIIEACNALRALTAERPEAAVAAVVKTYIDSALRWHPVFDDGRGGNDLTQEQTSQMMCSRLVAALAIQHEEPGRETMTSEPELCPGGIDPGFDECPKCGATMDDDCAYASPPHRGI
jgi:hypothetical protein